MNARKTALVVLLVAALVGFSGSSVLAQYPEPGHLPGIWAARYTTPAGLVHEQLVLMNNGTFTRSVVIGSREVITTGEYQVGMGVVRYYNEYNPRHPDTPRLEMHSYRFNTPNQVVFSDAVTGTTWTANRVAP
jgi:hypothetical protein